MLLLGAVVERAVVSSPYAVETHAVEGMQQAVESLGVAEEFPWLEAVTAKGQMDSEFHVVSSCPDGLREENSDWRVHATVIPSMAISLKSDVVFLGDAKTNSVITFYVGWEQRQYWTGPKLSEMGAWQGSQLAPGSYIGVGLTYDAAAKLILGTHAPFGVDVERRLHAPVAECMPRLTEELDGVSIEDLRAKLATCVDDEEAVAKGKLLRAERLRLVSVPLHSPATSAFCSVGFESKSAQ